jgi:hypothetical protein
VGADEDIDAVDLKKTELRDRPADPQEVDIAVPFPRIIPLRGERDATGFSQGKFRRQERLPSVSLHCAMTISAGNGQAFNLISGIPCSPYQARMKCVLREPAHNREVRRHASI